MRPVGSVSAIVPATGLDGEVPACLRALRGEPIDEVVVARWDAPAGGSERQLCIDAPHEVAAPSCAAALNEALHRVRGDVVLLVVPVARPRPGLVAAYLAHLRDGAGVVYGDYELHAAGAASRRRELHATEHDLSELSGFGYVRALRRAALLAVGGWDESFALCEDYDLRLRLGETTTFAHAGDALYDVHLPAGVGDRAAAREALGRCFTGDGGALPGFVYLYLAQRVSAEVARAFLACLDRRGARLADGTEVVACPHRGARPAVSVVIPTLDRERMLERAIATVRGGTFADFELLVVDNGSTDGTLALVEGLSRADPRVRLLRNPRPGIGSALNLGVAAARGAYVSQLDSDDEYVPDTLARQVAELDAHPDWGLAISYYDVIDENGELLPQYGVVRHEEYDRNAILRTGGAGAVRTWHRCVIEALGGFDDQTLDSYAEDYDLVLRAAERFTVGRVHDVLYRVRMHANNTDKRLGARFRATRKAEARRRALERRREIVARSS